MKTWRPGVPKLLESLDKKKVKTIKATGNMLLLPGGEEEEEGHDHGDEGHHHDYDPHVWLSPARAIKLVEHIRDSLSADYPDKKETFEKNAAAYIEKLQALDKSYTDGLSQAKQKSFVTQHALSDTWLWTTVSSKYPSQVSHQMQNHQQHVWQN